MMQALVKVGGFNLSVDGEEPRALDLEIAQCAGVARPRDVRTVIDRNWEELSAHGEIRVCGYQPQTSEGGRPGREYWLNEDQAVALVALMRTPKARELRIALVKCFRAYRDGLLPRAQPLSLDIAHGPRVGDVPNVREDLSALCAMTARASGHSLRRIHGFLRRTYRVPGIHHIALVLYPAVKQTLEAIGLGRLHLARALSAPVDKRQLALWKVN